LAGSSRERLRRLRRLIAYAYAQMGVSLPHECGRIVQIVKWARVVSSCDASPPTPVRDLVPVVQRLADARCNYEIGGAAWSMSMLRVHTVVTSTEMLESSRDAGVYGEYPVTRPRI
jgi:hypothetical protein